MWDSVCLCGAKGEEEHAGHGQLVERSNLDLYYLGLMRLYQKYCAQFCPPTYEAGAELPVKGHKGRVTT